MHSVILILLGLISLVLIVFIVWRFASRRYTIPCPSWLHWLVEFDKPFIKVNQVKFIIRNLDVQPGMKVLDIGCGPGRLTIPLAEKVGPEGQVIAIDLQNEMLKMVREKARIKKLNNIQFKNIKMGDGRLEHYQADRAVLVTVLGEIPNREAALKEIYGALKPGGILSIVEVILDPHFQSRGSVLKMISSIGFRQKLFFGNQLTYSLYLEKHLDFDN